MGLILILGDEVHVAYGGDLIRIDLGVASGNSDVGRGIVAMQAANEPARLAGGDVGDEAGVDHAPVCKLGLVHDHMAGFQQLAREVLTFALV